MYNASRRADHMAFLSSGPWQPPGLFVASSCTRFVRWKYFSPFFSYRTFIIFLFSFFFIAVKFFSFFLFVHRSFYFRFAIYVDIYTYIRELGAIRVYSSETCALPWIYREFIGAFAYLVREPKRYNRVCVQFEFAKLVWVAFCLE